MGLRRAVRRRGDMARLKRVHLPRCFLFFDTECRIEHVDAKTILFPLRLGVAICVVIDETATPQDRHVYIFRSNEDFIRILQYLTNRFGLVTAIAHNIGFDVRVLDLPRLFAAIDWTNEPPIMNQRVFIWQVKTENGRVDFLDTANYGVFSVEQLGRDMGYPKLSVDFDQVDDTALAAYCRRDVEILETFMLEYLRFLVHHDLGPFRSTIASQAMATFRYKFMQRPPFIHKHDQTLWLERDAYHGGRTEAWFIGPLPVDLYYYVDINSMYPWAMIAGDLPIRLRGYSVDVPVSYLRPRLFKFYCIADVTLDTDEPAYPLVENNKLLFPEGSFRTCLHQDELVDAFWKGRVKQVHRMAVYDKGPIFRDYVTFFYGLKEQYSRENNRTWRYITKLFQNSLYGKFGQLQPYREVIGQADPDLVWRMSVFSRATYEFYQEIGWYGTVYREGRSGETPNSCPAIAGAITARARMALWASVVAAGRPNVFYMDTDSLIVNSAGLEGLRPFLDPVELGKLKIEDMGHLVSIYGAKDYVFNERAKTKGVPASAVEIREGVWQYLQFQGFVTWMKDGATGPPGAEEKEKTRRGQYDKGKVLKDGRVIPWLRF